MSARKWFGQVSPSEEYSMGVFSSVDEWIFGKKAKMVLTYDTDAIRDCIADAANIADATSLLADNEQQRTKLLGAATRLRKLSKRIGVLETFRTDYNSLKGLYDAWGAINQNSSPEENARAYGKLFKHAGAVGRYLPPPLNSYAEFLGGFENFFVDMKRAMDPMTRPNGRQLRELRESGDF
jgi:hypothetical protein